MVAPPPCDYDKLYLIKNQYVPHIKRIWDKPVYSTSTCFGPARPTSL